MSNSVQVRVYDTSLVLLAVVDTCENVYFERKLSDIGNFELQINWNILDNAGFRYADYFKRGRFITIGTDLRRVGIIQETRKKVGSSGKGSQIVTVKGSEAKGILGRRVVVPPSGQEQFALTDQAETVMKSVVLNQAGSSAIASRQMSILTIATDLSRGADITYTSRFKSLTDDLKSISQATGLGWYCYLDLTTSKLVFDVIQGLNRTASQTVNPRAIISTDFDTLQDGTLTDSEIAYKNIVIAAGQGVGVNRAIQTVFSGTEPTGIERREMFQDMRDLDTTTKLNARGATLLAEKAFTNFVDATALNYSQLTLAEDYDLGDLVTVSAYDESTDVQITGVKESWGANKYDIGLTFSRAYPEFPKEVASKNQEMVQTFTNTEIGPQASSTVTGNYTLKSTDRLVLVNTNNAITITVPVGLPIGHEFTVQRISSGLTTNAVTLSGTGLPFTSMFGNTVAKTARYSEAFTFRQVSSTGNSWICVGGSDSGGNINGNYDASYDGDMKCWYEFTTIPPFQNTATYGWFTESQLWTYPKGYISRPSVSWSTYDQSGFASWCMPTFAGPTVASSHIFSPQARIGLGEPTTAKQHVSTTGRWY